MTPTLDAPDTLLSRWDPRWKLVSLLCSIFVVASLQNLATICIALCGSWILLLLASQSVKASLYRFGIVLLLFVPCFLILPWQVGDASAGSGLKFAWSGVWLALTLYLRAVAILCITLTLLTSTPITLLLHAAQKLHVPKLFIQITLLAYRYLFTLGQEMKSARKALVTRGFENRFSLRSLKSLAHVIGMIMVRSYEKTERIYQAMLCRGYSGIIHGTHPFQTTKNDPILSFICMAWIAVLLGIDTVQS